MKTATRCDGSGARRRHIILNVSFRLMDVRCFSDFYYFLLLLLFIPYLRCILFYNVIYHYTNTHTFVSLSLPPPMSSTLFRLICSRMTSASAHIIIILNTGWWPFHVFLKRSKRRKIYKTKTNMISSNSKLNTPRLKGLIFTNGHFHMALRFLKSSILPWIRSPCIYYSHTLYYKGKKNTNRLLLQWLLHKNAAGLLWITAHRN